jgi:hypothetical protein
MTTCTENISLYTESPDTIEVEWNEVETGSQGLKWSFTHIKSLSKSIYFLKNSKGETKTMFF